MIDTALVGGQTQKCEIRFSITPNDPRPFVLQFTNVASKITLRTYKITEKSFSL